MCFWKDYNLVVAISLCYIIPKDQSIIPLDYFKYSFQIMSNLAKFEFVTLPISGKLFIWILDAKIHLNNMNLEKTIKK